MGTLVSILLIIAFIAFIAICAVAYSVYRSLVNIKYKFTSMFNGKGKPGGNGRTAYGSGDETIIDNRTPDEMNRKIFSKNEGEYVDFEEER